MTNGLVHSSFSAPECFVLLVFPPYFMLYVPVYSLVAVLVVVQ